MHTCAFNFVLIVSLLYLSLILTGGFNHIGNSTTDGPKDTSLTDMLSQSNNSQLPRVLLLLPSQVCIPAACLLQILCLLTHRELTQSTMGSKRKANILDHFSNLKVAQRGAR